MVRSLQKEGIIVEILSGDEQSSVESFAKKIGIDPKICRGNVDPEGKAQWVIDRSKARRTLMAGDGFNDAGALAAANIGVAVGSGDQVNLEAADIMFPGDEPKMLLELHDLSRKMNNALIGNIVISILITMTLVVAVINEWYDQLWVGVLVHEASVLLVIINGARLAGKDSMIGILWSVIKSLWSDTKTVFIQFKQHFFSQSVTQNTSEIDLHATS